MQNILRNIVWGCLIIIPFLALYVATGRGFDIFSFGDSGMYFPFISGKNIYFRVLAEIAFAGWILLAIKDASYRFSAKKSPLFIAYSVFIAVLFVADLLGVDVHRSMWSNFERMEGFVGHIHLYLYFVVLTGMLATVSDWSKQLKWFVVSSIAVNLYAFGQLLGAKGLIFEKLMPGVNNWFNARFPIDMSTTRLDSTLGNSAYYGVYTLMFVFICAILLVQATSKRAKWVYGVLIGVNVIGLFYSGTRGSMIGLLIGAVTTLGIMAYFEKGKSRKVLAAAVVGIAVFVFALFAAKNTDFVKNSPTLNRLASISANDVTGASRIAMWTISYEAWKERPVLGYGQDNFTYVFARKFDPVRMGTLEPWYDRSHDVFFDWLIAAGLVGLVSYLSLYAVALWLMWGKKNDMPVREKALITGMLVGYFIHNVFVFDNLISYIMFAMFLAFISVRTSIAHDHVKHRNLHISDENMRLLVLPAVGIILFFTQYFVNYQPMYVNMLMLRALDANNLVQKYSFTDALARQTADFKEAIALNTLGSEEAREQFSQTALRMAQVTIPPEVPQEEKQKLAEAMNGLLLAVKQDIDATFDHYKEEPRMLSIYGMFLNSIGDSAGAEKVLTQAHLVAPKKQLITYDLVRAQLMGGKYKEAYALAKETYELAPKNPASVKWYVIASVYAGAFKETKAAIAKDGQVIPFDQEILNAALSIGQIQVAIEMLQDLKKEQPAAASQIDAYIKQISQMPRTPLAAPKK
jgi:O-antigen ligase/tetratricopeptide (TPR) repeat protein